MIISLKSFLHNIKMHPLRGILTIITITIGAATLIISTSLNIDINSALISGFQDKGFPVVIANGEISENGQIIMQEPAVFTPDIDTILAKGYENISDIAIVAEAWVMKGISVNDKSYQIRTVVQASETYRDLMDLDIISGSFFTREDIEERRHSIVISSLTARLLYGSANAAVGETIRFSGKDGFNPYRIAGVFQEVSELERRLYGIGDFIFPVGAGLPKGFDVHPIQYGAVVMGRIVNDSIRQAESRVRSVLEQEYGDDIQLSVWEGSASGPSTMLAESRESVRNFGLAINILGIIILAISSIGIFSIMLVEVLNRNREIGLRRVMGITKAGIRNFFMIQAAYYSLFGSITGICISLIFYNTVGRFLIPLFDSSGLRMSDMHMIMPEGISLVFAVSVALIFGVLFGLFPAISAANTPIAECIREDAA